MSRLGRCWISAIPHIAKQCNAGKTMTTISLSPEKKETTNHTGQHGKLRSSTPLMQSTKHALISHIICSPRGSLRWSPGWTLYSNEESDAKKNHSGRSGIVSSGCWVSFIVTFLVSWGMSSQSIVCSSASFEKASNVIPLFSAPIFFEEKVWPRKHAQFQWMQIIEHSFFNSLIHLQVSAKEIIWPHRQFNNQLCFPSTQLIVRTGGFFL